MNKSQERINIDLLTAMKRPWADYVYYASEYDMNGALYAGGEKLQNFYFYGREASPTHLSVIGGSDYCGANYNEHLFDDDEKGIKDITFSSYYLNDDIFADPMGKIFNYRDDCGAIRPCLHFSSTEDFNVYTKNKYINKDGISELVLGFYPQYAPSISIQKELESNKSELCLSDRIYTLPGISYIDNTIKYKKKNVYRVYKYNNKEYIRISHDLWEFNLQYDRIKYCFYKDMAFDIGVSEEEFLDMPYLWIEVMPVIWYVDENAKALVSKYSLLSGIERSKDIKYFLKKYVLKELLTEEDTLMYEKEIARNKKIKLLGDVRELVKEIQSLDAFIGDSMDETEIPTDIIMENNKKNIRKKK